MNTNRAEYVIHEPVMASEVCNLVKNLPEGYFIDATYGNGSHYERFLNFNQLNLIGFDRDNESIKNSTFPQNVFHCEFINIPNFLDNNNIPLISGIFFDYGVSTHQISTPSRGFSFQLDGPLDMRMDKENKTTAKDILDNYSIEQLTRIFKEYGEEKYSKKIANVLVQNRNLSTTKDLVELIASSLPKQNPIYTKKSIRRIFQALRIEVNDELRQIKNSLKSISRYISKDGKILCLTYHSLEDKIVKTFFDNISNDCVCESSIPICICEVKPEFKMGKPKKIKPTKDEIFSNPKSKSAILRHVVKL